VTRFGALALVLLSACTGADDDSSSGQELSPDALVAADGVHVDAVSLFQGTEIEMMSQGLAVDPASQVPLIGGRNAMARVFVSTDPSYNQEDVVARLTIGEHQVEHVKTITSKSSKFSLSSTFNFDVDGSLLESPDNWRVELLQTRDQSTGENPGAITDSVPFDTPTQGATLKILLIPISYGADESQRAPDTSPEQLALYRAAFLATYPVSDVEISVGDPLPTTTVLEPAGGGWDDMLHAMTALRSDRAVPHDTYLYGLVSPASDQASYCEAGCTLGNSYYNQSGSASLRVGVGLGFSGAEAVSIAIHELGHQHGRPHAPCEVPDPDPSYPYPDGEIGRWGFDPRDRTLVAPQGASDFMSYCAPAWVSDYTFRALLERSQMVDATSGNEEASSAKSYQVVRVSADGRMRRGAAMVLPSRPTARLSTRRGSLDGREIELTGHFVHYAHLPGGVLLIP